MSTKQNDIILEDFEQRFEEIIATKAWHELDNLYFEMQDKGSDKEMVELSQRLSAEDVLEIARFNKEDNEVQNEQ